MDYGKYKQGTIIHRLRLEQYPNKECSAIIITAECDIAQCKVSKFYYLTAMDVRTWVGTDGLSYTTNSKQLTRLKKFICKFNDKVPGLVQYQNAATLNLDDIEVNIRNLPSSLDTSAALKELSAIRELKATQNQI